MLGLESCGAVCKDGDEVTMDGNKEIEIVAWTKDCLTDRN
jgi:hypothetical protein